MRFVCSRCCARGKRPPDRRTAKKCDELAPLHVSPARSTARLKGYHVATAMSALGQKRT